MKNTVGCLIAALTAAMYVSPVHAYNDYGNGVFGGEITFGGDELGATYDGSGDKLDELNAGGLFHIYAGYDFLLDSDPETGLGLRTSIGWLFDSVSADNGDIDFERFPLSFILHQRLNSLDLGAGFTYHLNPSYDPSEIGQRKIKFDDTLGFRLELGYPINEQSDITFSATLIDYQADNLPDLSGNSIGIGFRLGF
jgi:hypothetical protein